MRCPNAPSWADRVMLTLPRCNIPPGDRVMLTLGLLYNKALSSVAVPAFSLADRKPSWEHGAS
jgi:hypothetical protein